MSIESFGYMMLVFMGVSVVIILGLFANRVKSLRRLLEHYRLVSWVGIGIGFIAVLSNVYFIVWIAVAFILLGLIGLIAYGRA